MSKNIYLDSSYNLSDVCEDYKCIKIIKIQKSHFIEFLLASFNSKIV